MAIQHFYKPMTRRVFTYSQNEQYEQTTTYTDTTINGYIGSRNSTEQYIGKETIRTQYKFYSDTMCNYGDEIIYNSETYRIIDDSHDAVNKAHHYKALIEKVDKNVE